MSLANSVLKYKSGGLAMKIREKLAFLRSMRSRRVLALSILILFFSLQYQNCSKVQFAETSLSSLGTGSVVVGERIQTITPSYSQSSSANKIKVLLVVDNSPTMTNSQTNLANKMNSLLSEIQNYDAEVKIITSTFFDSNCNGYASGCTSVPALKYSSSAGTSSNSSGQQQISRVTSLVDSEVNPVFKISKNMTGTQKAQVVSQISAAVTGVGQKGSDSEAPFASLATQLDSQISNFFSAGDRALFLVITDEDDSYSISNLQKSSYIYTNSINENKSEPGIQAGYSGFRPGGGFCVQRNELGQIVSSYTVTAPMFTSLSDCQSFVSSSNTGGNCSYGACGSSNDYLSIQSLNGKDLNTRCNELKSDYKAIYNISSCTAATYNYVDTTDISKSERGILDLTSAQLSDAQSKGVSASAFLTSVVKSKMDSLFNGKYLISVFANLKGQGCSLSTGQSYDTFFSSLSSTFGSANFMINSICDANNSTSAAAIEKVATEFSKILNDNYLVSLAGAEYIHSAKIYFGSNTAILKEGIDFKIENNSLKILNSNYSTFDKIELIIKSH